MPSMRSGAEDAHQVVFERQEELRGAGVALAAGAAAQLVVDAPALVPLGADDEQAAGRQHHLPVGGDLGADAGAGRPRSAGSFSSWRDAHVDVAAELDVGAAAGHVGGDGDGAAAAGLGDDLRFLLVVAGVQHLVRDLVLLQQVGQQLRLLDRDGADQHRLAALAAFLDQLDDRVVLLARRCGRPRRRRPCATHGTLVGISITSSL